jgi:predicted DsbA family dithiol-disulfide isomerase
MEIEIWSDVMCPFCYIGKRRIERALSQFGHSSDIQIEWKSFQLNPGLKTEPGKTIDAYLAENKGWTLEYARQMNQQVTDMAKEEGLIYNMDRAVVANSFDAHRLLQLAKTKQLGHIVEELLFKAYFTDGQNTADRKVLTDIGLASGLERPELEHLFDTDAFSDLVQQDIDEAQQLGIRGVPFFVFNRQYAISGAQDPEVFINTLKKSFSLWQSQ